MLRTHTRRGAPTTKRLRKRINGRRRSPKTTPVVALNEVFAENNNAGSRTEYGSARDGLQTEVRSTDEEINDHDDDKIVELGDDAMACEQLWGENDYILGFLETRKTFNLSMVFHFKKALRSLPRSEWMGKNGIVLHICDIFKLPKKKRRVVRRILNYFYKRKTTEVTIRRYEPT